jgi:ABC-type uncharacterized transport system auxiliary subunit
MKKYLQPFLAICVLLSACTSSRPAPTIYALHATPESPSNRKITRTISIPVPEVPTGFDSEKVALYLNGGRRLDYYANMAWPDHLGKVLQNIIVRSAATVPGLLAITPDSGGTASHDLLVKVNDFEPVYTGGANQPPRLKVSLTFRLVSRQSQRTLFVFTLEDERRAASNNQSAVVAGLEALLNDINNRAFQKIGRIL